MTALDLSANPIGDAGALALAALLESPLCALRHLDLHACNISDVGGAALLRSLGRGGLTSLNLRANDLSDALVPAIAEAASSDTALQTLLLQGNDFTPRGLAALPKARFTADFTTAGLSLESVCAIM